MPGETNLQAMLASLSVTVRDVPYAVAHIPEPVPLGDGVAAVIAEEEGVTVVATLERARREGWRPWLEAAWITLDVHSALEAVGLTAAVAAALTEAGIPCNVLAAAYHDHLLVPWDRRGDAAEALTRLRSQTSTG